MTWPGITSKLIYKHLTLSLLDLKGRLKQDQNKIIPTKKIATKEKPETEASLTQEYKTQDCFFSIPTKEYGTTYSDPLEYTQLF